MYHTNNIGKIEQWLNLIINKHFSENLVLSFSKVWQITYKEFNHKLYIEGNPKFYTYGKVTFGCARWNSRKEGFYGVVDEILPLPGIDIYSDKNLIEFMDDGDIIIHYDILGLAYWMMSRAEEVGRESEFDQHGRFPAEVSHAYQYGYLDRPIVDEWFNILGQVMKRVWPEIELKQHQGSMKVTCDVDHPYMYYKQSIKKLVRAVAADVVKRRSLTSALMKIKEYLSFRRNPSNDKMVSVINWMMDVNEEAGHRVAFYFIPQSHHELDGGYALEHPCSLQHLKTIDKRGHEIGYHASYNTYENADLAQSEVAYLNNVLDKLSIEQRVRGGRQHYLHWKTPVTMYNWERAGLEYDSTLAYAQYAGFRCGTCFDYPMINPVTHEILATRQRPLIMMEGSVLGKNYMNKNYEDALAYMQLLKDRCYKVGGYFTMLWHNSFFEDEDYKQIYVGLLRHNQRR